MTSFRLTALFVVAFIIGSLATSNLWEISLQEKPSPKSRFYVLSNWNQGGGVYKESVSSPFPASQVSNIMLKTMGILREGVTWSGVQLGNLFRRPRATVLFLVNGLSDDNDISELSDHSYPVDQTGLTGLTSEDEETIFKGDNVLEHFRTLFEGKSLTMKISGTNENNVDINKNTPSIEVFDVHSPVDRQFLKELVTIKESVKKLSQAAVNDAAPDIYVFTFNSLKTLQSKYSSQSHQMRIAIKLVTDTIKEVTQELVQLYHNDIIIQALVLQWKHNELNDEQLVVIQQILENHELSNEQIDKIMKELPSFAVPNMPNDLRDELCANLNLFLKYENGKLEGDCLNTRIRRNSDRPDENSFLKSDNSTYKYGNPRGLAEERSDNFPAIFLIIFTTIVPIGLSLFAISWAMWNMDPGRDSVIYRNTDSVGIKLE